MLDFFGLQQRRFRTPNDILLSFKLGYHYIFIGQRQNPGQTQVNSTTSQSGLQNSSIALIIMKSSGQAISSIVNSEQGQPAVAEDEVMPQLTDEGLESIHRVSSHNQFGDEQTINIC